MIIPTLTITHLSEIEAFIKRSIWHYKAKGSTADEITILMPNWLRSLLEENEWLHGLGTGDDKILRDISDVYEVAVLDSPGYIITVQATMFEKSEPMAGFNIFNILLSCSDAFN